jgi:kinesin family member C1
MQGSGNGSMRGIIPRAMEQIGKYKTELESRGWKYEMEVCFIEIYNETIRDLLRQSPNDDIKHDIKRESNGHTYISDVTMLGFDPNDVEKIDSIMELAARHRSVSQTLMNERSSRSHSVFMVYLSATNEAQNVHLKGTLSLVDLAGSERLDRSGAAGARMKETVAINKSLSSLVDVFTAIGNKQSHIPFRNSKLTYLLQSALSGDGKTLMLVNVSPTEESYFESLCSLRLAKQVNQCELGKPKRQCASGNSTSSNANSSSTASSSVSSASSSMKTSAMATPSSRGKTLASSTGPSYRK